MLLGRGGDHHLSRLGIRSSQLGGRRCWLGEPNLWEPGLGDSNSHPKKGGSSRRPRKPAPPGRPGSPAAAQLSLTDTLGPRAAPREVRQAGPGRGALHVVAFPAAEEHGAAHLRG